jgi:hypothetical protein
MTPVRSADMNRTPDVRTRAILPEWACKKELPCSCQPWPVEHEQDWINKREYVWVCASCGHRKEWNH